ncbi:M10 family metallopeptidase [Campylobacterota bacterium DY0563]
MTRNEKIAVLYVTIFGTTPNEEELKQYTSFNDNISLEVISATMMHNSEYLDTYKSLETDDFVKTMFQSIFGFTDDEMQSIIEEQERNELNGGINGFDYWVNEIENNPYITEDTLPIAIINGTSLDDEQSLLSQVEDILYPQSYTNYTYGELANFYSDGVAELNSWTYWDDSRTTFTYSFNDYIPYSYYEYGSELTEGFEELTLTSKNMVRSVFEEIETVLGIEFNEVSDNGDFRFSSVEQDSHAFAFYPDAYYDFGGDVFLSKELNESTYVDYVPGTYNWMAIVHELGHAFGLEHPFNDENNEEPHLEVEYDNAAYSIMSYTQFNYYQPVVLLNDRNENTLDFIQSFPELYSVYDLNALQWQYGVNDTTNTEDNIYKIKYSDFSTQTIWDAGGVDTIDLSNTKGNTTLDLNGGTINSIDEYTFDQILYYCKLSSNTYELDSEIEDILAEYYESDSLYTGKNNFGIATGTIIENINTGSGNDRITDNEVNNIINTANGNDIIYLGNGGYDKIDGGNGIDTIYLDYFLNQLTFTDNKDASYLVNSNNYAAEFTNIENIVLADHVQYTVADLLA